MGGSTGPDETGERLLAFRVLDFGGRRKEEFYKDMNNE